MEGLMLTRVLRDLSQHLPARTLGWAFPDETTAALLLDGLGNFSPSGMVYGRKLHAWTALNGKVVKYDLRPANEHAFTVKCPMNHDWSAYGEPKLTGDKGEESGTYLTPPRKNAGQPDPRWRAEYGAARKIVEAAFSAPVAMGPRWGRVKTPATLRLEVALIVLAYNLRFRSLSPFP